MIKLLKNPSTAIASDFIVYTKNEFPQILKNETQIETTNHQNTARSVRNLYRFC
jgi:hypothetical protein